MNINVKTISLNYKKNCSCGFACAQVFLFFNANYRK